jgi:hypothetical protein
MPKVSKESAAQVDEVEAFRARPLDGGSLHLRVDGRAHPEGA